jgi:hypothetical protein
MALSAYVKLVDTETCVNAMFVTVDRLHALMEKLGFKRESLIKRMIELLEINLKEFKTPIGSNAPPARTHPMHHHYSLLAHRNYLLNT